jgi:hypothetical protein
MRIKYCTKCDTYFHRDILGAENIIHAGRGILLTGRKPNYLPKWNKKKNGDHSNNIQEIKDTPIKRSRL